MNVGSWISGLLNGTVASDVRVLKLTPGQVVQGTVLRVSEDGQEAELQIQGVRVKAVLETPLQAGQTALLTVTPSEVDGLPMLKPIPQANLTSLPSLTLADVLAAAELPVTEEHQVLVQTMNQNGLSLNPDQVREFAKLLAQKPAQLNSADWITATVIAKLRGLPLTAEVVRSLQQVITGPPLERMLEKLDVLHQMAISKMTDLPEKQAARSSEPSASARQVQSPTQSPLQQQAGHSELSLAGRSKLQVQPSPSVTLSDAPTAAGAPPSREPLQPLLARLTQVLAQLRSSPPVPAQLGGTSALGAAAPAPPPGAGAEAAPATAPAAPPAEAARRAQPGPNPFGPGPGATPAALPWVARHLQLLGAQHEQQVWRAMTAPDRPAGPGTATGPAGPGGGGDVAAAPDEPATMLAGSAPAPLAAGGAPEGLARAMRAGEPVVPPGHGGAPALAPGPERAGQDTLKGILLQLVEHPDAPPALREAAHQVVTQLTGQQLLLSGDRSAPFTQVTMFVPLPGMSHSEPAMVQIASRQGRKGELDASNCRLWFDLTMQHLGHTKVDVQVIDRVVNVHVHHESDFVGALLERSREEMSSALDASGYRLLTLRAVPLPETAPSELGNHKMEAGDFVPPRYKGVDYKI